MQDVNMISGKMSQRLQNEILTSNFESIAYESKQGIRGTTSTVRGYVSIRGHVKDMAMAFVTVLGNEKAYGHIYNINDAKNVTFNGIAKASAIADGSPVPRTVQYNPKDFDFSKKKAFSLRDQHIFTSAEKVEKELSFTPEYGLIDGWKDSYNLDFGRGTSRKAANFPTDDMTLEKLGYQGHRSCLDFLLPVIPRYSGKLLNMRQICTLKP
uniref:Uncharacterized protein n=2 Tax=Physcomitrium patens TaxID=3218 RepID=A0A7I4F9Y5_PHYPA